MRKENITEHVSASHFYGVWNDDECMDADSLVVEVRKDRKFKDDITAF